MGLKEIKTDEFDKEVLESDSPVLVDFWAPWCVPCKMVTPVLEAIAGETDPSVLTIVKVNVDEETDIAAKYNITSIPAMRVFVAGEIVKEINGAKPKPGLLKELKDFL
jgi:thioredoxin 1